MRSAGLDRHSRGLDLLAAFDRARSGDHGQALAADLDSGHIDTRALRPHFAGG
jgi:hypothetical protein